MLSATKGADRNIKRGQSYYTGDPLNKALVKPEAIESVLKQVKQAASGLAQPLPENPDAEKPEPLLKSKRAWFWTYIGTVSPAALMGAFDWRVQMLIVGSIIGISINSLITMQQVQDKLQKLVEAL